MLLIKFCFLQKIISIKIKKQKTIFDIHQILKMKKIIILLLLIIPFKWIFSQSEEDFIKLSNEKFEKKDFKYALVLIEKVIALDVTNQWYYLKKAEIEFNLYGPMQALKTVKKSIRINSKTAEPYNRAGLFYSSAGYADSAILMFDLAIKNSNDNDTMRFTYLLNRGSAKAAVMDFTGAAKDYETVLSFNPNDLGALNNVATVYDELGYLDKTIRILKNVISIDSTMIGSYINLGFQYSKMDSLNLAIQYFDKALALDPNEALVYSNRGYAYYKKGNYTKALEDINFSIRLYPSNSYAYRNLALIYIATNSIKEACTALNYADFYGFEKNYGTEVAQLIAKYCEK